MKPFKFHSVFILCICFFYANSQITRPFAIIPKINAAPLIDGKIEEKEWQNAVLIDDFVIWTMDAYTIDKVQTYLAYDKNNIYVAFKGSFADKKLFTNTLEEYKEIDSHLWGRNHFGVKLSSGNTTIDLKAAPLLSKMDFKNGDLAWNGSWTFKAAINEDNWTGEFKIPIADMGLNTISEGQIWQLQLTRCHPSGISAEWNGSLKFSENNFIKINVGDWPNARPQKNALAVQLNNHSTKKETIFTEISLLPFSGNPIFPNQQGQGNSNADMQITLRSQAIVFKKKFEISPKTILNQTIEYELNTEGNYYASIICKNAAGNTLSQSSGYWFTIAENTQKIQLLSKKLAETTSFVQIINQKFITQSNNLSAQLLELQKTKTAFWKSNKWDDLSEKLSALETRIIQYSNEVKVANLNTGSHEKSFGLITTHPLQKIKRDEAFLGDFTSDYELMAAKNEYESFQMILLPFGTDIKNISIVSSDLKHNNGSFISKENIEISLVDYNFIQFQANYLTDKKPWHPDPLLPIKKPFDIKGNEICRPIWVTIHVPKEANSGIYDANIEVIANGSEKLSIALKVKVYDFELPQVSSLKTHTWNEIELMYKFYNLKELPIDYYINFSELLLKNRLNPSFAGINYVDKNPKADGTYDFTKADKLLSNVIPKGLSKFSMLQMKKGDYAAGELEKEYKFIKAYSDFLRSKGWLDKALIELWDEPTVLEWEGVKERALAVKKIAPDLKTQLFCAGVGPFKFWDDDVSKKYGLNDVIDIWMPIYPIEAPEVQKSGHELWAYFATLPRSNAPNFFIDSPAIYQRMIPWHCFMYNLDGFEHWSTTYITRNVKEGEPIENKWPNALWDSRTFHDFHGEGQMVYPGPDGNFWPSIRLETFRDGMDDYEYLHKLKNLLKTSKLNKDDIRILKAKNLLNISESILIKYPSDIQETLENTIRHANEPTLILNTRKQIAEAIEDLMKQ